MTPDDRAKWCIAQAEAIEAETPAVEEGQLLSMDALAARWWRDMAFRVAAQNGEGRA